MSKDFSIPYIAFFGRPLDEYLAMFMLTEADLRSGKTLDIASGPSSFRAEGTELHHDIVACDPMYKLSPEEILAYGRSVNNPPHSETCRLEHPKPSAYLQILMLKQTYPVSLVRILYERLARFPSPSKKTAVR